MYCFNLPKAKSVPQHVDVVNTFKKTTCKYHPRQHFPLNLISSDKGEDIAKDWSLVS